MVDIRTAYPGSAGGSSRSTLPQEEPREVSRWIVGLWQEGPDPEVSRVASMLLRGDGHAYDVAQDRARLLRDQEQPEEAKFWRAVAREIARRTGQVIGERAARHDQA